MFGNLKDYLKRVFELDLRSLAVTRVSLGFLSVIDCLFRLQDLEAHYTDFGVMPLNSLYSLYTPRGPCLHCFSSSFGWLYLIFGLHILTAILFMVGWKTKASNFFLWLFTISLHFRNPLIIDGGDVLLRCFLLWMFFLPTAEYYSIDAKHKKVTATQTTWWLNPMLALQLFMLYFTSALLKTGADWWPLGTAAGYALSLEAFVTPFGKWMTQFPETLRFLTRAVYLVELWGPFLLLCWGRLRLLGVFIFVCFHAGLGLCLDLALFPWFAYACLFALVPREFWEFVKKTKDREHYQIPNFQKAFSVLGLPFFCLAIAWNVYTYIQKPLNRIANDSAQWLHIDQYWGMFAPYPLKDSGWYEFGVRLWDGQYVYTFVDDKMESEWNQDKGRPENTYHYYVDQRWKKYLVNLWDKSNAKYRPLLAAYLCRKWNRENVIPSDKALKLDMVFTLYQNVEYLKPARGPSSIDLGNYDCPQDVFVNDK